MEITVKLTVDELNAVLQCLGNLPTSSGAFPLMMKIRQQAEGQVKPPAAMPDVAVTNAPSRAN
jgi:hypothetical protein